MDRNRLYSKYLELRNEIMKHKWLESEKVGRDIGFEDALVDWIKLHHNEWLKSKVKQIN